jgi:hypothetical protein
VLLATVEVEDCEVIKICNQERSYVLSPANFRYWLPTRPMGDLVRAVCCPQPECASGSSETVAMPEGRMALASGSQGERRIKDFLPQMLLAACMPKDRICAMGNAIDALGPLLELLIAHRRDAYLSQFPDCTGEGQKEGIATASPAAKRMRVFDTVPAAPRDIDLSQVLSSLGQPAIAEMLRASIQPHLEKLVEEKVAAELRKTKPASGTRRSKPVKDDK